MSLLRSIWNDGQSVTTPELQRNNDIAAYADDRALEVLATPGSVLKRVMPTSEESATVNPRLLIIPSASNGKVTCQPAWFEAATTAQSISMAATLGASLDIPANIASNVSGVIRYDLIYATVNRQVAATIGSPPSGAAYCGIGQANTGTSSTQSRKIKSVVDGSISTQAVNLYDVPQVQLAVNQGFLTGATAPTIAQINAALPADTATSFNFALGYITVANGFTAGNAIAQSSAGGSTYIVQAWSGGWMQPQRSRGFRPGSLYYGSATEKPSSSLTTQVQLAERWGSDERFFLHMKVTSSTPLNSAGWGDVIDNTIDWRHRFISGFWGYLGSGTNLPLENGATLNGASNGNAGAIPMCFSGAGVANVASASSTSFAYNSNGSTLCLQIDNSSGQLRIARQAGALVDGTNGDVIVLMLVLTDRLLPSI